GEDLDADLGTSAATEPSSLDVTVVEGWTLGARLVDDSRPGVERLPARRAADGTEAILTLFNPGGGPDPAVYGVVRNLPLERVAQLFDTGVWDGRRFEVFEEPRAGTLASLSVDPADEDAVYRIVEQIGLGLSSLALRGLRHRDLRSVNVG